MGLERAIYCGRALSLIRNQVHSTDRASSLTLKPHKNPSFLSSCSIEEGGGNIQYPRNCYLIARERVRSRGCPKRCENIWHYLADNWAYLWVSCTERGQQEISNCMVLFWGWWRSHTTFEDTLCILSRWAASWLSNTPVDTHWSCCKAPHRWRHFSVISCLRTLTDIFLDTLWTVQLELDSLLSDTSMDTHWSCCKAAHCWRHFFGSHFLLYSLWRTFWTPCMQRRAYRTDPAVCAAVLTQYGRQPHWHRKQRQPQQRRQQREHLPTATVVVSTDSNWIEWRNLMHSQSKKNGKKKQCPLVSANHFRCFCLHTIATLQLSLSVWSTFLGLAYCVSKTEWAWRNARLAEEVNMRETERK